MQLLCRLNLCLPTFAAVALLAFFQTPAAADSSVADPPETATAAPSETADAAAPSESSPDSSGDDSRLELHLYMKGRYIYQKVCVDCHGATGRGNGPWAADFTVKPRNFRSGLFKFRSTQYGTLPTKEDLRRTIRNGISGTAMPVFADLSEEEVEAVIAYLQKLSKNWRDPDLAPVSIPIPETPKWFDSPEELAKHATAGAPKFAAICAPCHGETGRGDGPAGKGLIDGWDNPITPAALVALHHKSGDTPRDLYRTIATGLNGTPMVGYHGMLKEEEIWDLVAWIEKLPKEEIEP